MMNRISTGHQTGNEDPQLYDVWQLPFEFDDKRGVFKNRPVIVGSIEEDTIEVFIVSVKVTSHPPRENFPGEVALLDWKQAGLTKPSTARCSHVARLPKRYFEGRLKYGKLSDRDADAVDNALRQLGMLLRLSDSGTIYNATLGHPCNAILGLLQREKRDRKHSKFRTIHTAILGQNDNAILRQL